jgi:V/A-type H+-transporting ATPase subunit F
MSSYRIAVVGQKEAVQGFALLGVDIVPAYTPEEAVEALQKLKKTMQADETGRERNQYAIVFVTEDLMVGISAEDERKLSKGALPAIISLPSHRGSSGYALDRLKRIVERAVGSNILQ